MKQIDAVLTEIDHSIDRADLEDFIARGWIRPLRNEADYIFEDIDISRIRLVCELRIDMKFEFDAIDIILSLMDQLYETKTRHERLLQALEKQPDNVRDAISKSFHKIT